MALTDRQIKAMQSEDKPRRYHDAGSVPGLYIEVSPSGGKWWRFRFSLNGKQRLMSLGVYPDVSLKEARLAVLEARQLVAAGRDPVRERAGARSAVACHSVREVAGEWLAGQEGRWTAAHATKVRSRLERLVFPAIGERGGRGGPARRPVVVPSGRERHFSVHGARHAGAAEQAVPVCRGQRPSGFGSVSR